VSSKYSYLTGLHDLSLPEWGPYSKKYFGISHLTDPERGLRFDLAVMPGLYRRQLGIPDALRPSGYLPHAVAGDLNDYSYRQQLGNDDEIFADIAFARQSEHCRLIECRCVNQTDIVNAFGIHLVSSLEAPPETPLRVTLAAGCRWFDALKQPPLARHVSQVRDHLTWDALRRGEVREANSGTAGGAVELKPGDRLRFPGFAAGRALLRVKNPGAEVAAGCFGGVNFTVAPDGSYQNIPLSNVDADAVLELNSGCLRIAGAADGDLAPETAFTAPKFTAHVSPGPLSTSRILQFDSVKRVYGIWWSESGSFFRHYHTGRQNDFLLYRDAIHQPFFPPEYFEGDKDVEWFDAVIQPLTLAPGERGTVYAAICDGETVEEVSTMLRQMASLDLPASFARSRAGYWQPASISAGENYRTGRERLAAVTLTNVVYPIWFKGKNVRHHAPGRCWNSLYTWDSGFIGLGLAEIDKQRAVENLNAYLTEPDDDECAFVHHGSPVPTQFYLYQEIMNRWGDLELGRQLYPNLRHYYRFMAGRADGSTMRGKHGQTLIRSWDYFYNSGGWDDYPPQHYLHHHKLLDAAPAVGSSHVICCAKILITAARELGFADDIATYEKDITDLSKLLQRDSWDPEAGYYSYVRYTDDEQPTGILRHESGVNFNMGLDGASPLLTGICTSEQRQRLWQKLQSPDCCWTPSGLSAVDQSAPYYRTDGYWNGSVWMPHQWFFWKAALDDGLADFAWQIAKTALNVYEHEVQTAHYCYENFAAATGRGGGWHHFSALSCPVLSWFGSYFEPGRLTGGLDTTIRDFRRMDKEWTAQISARPASVLLAVTAGPLPRATLNGQTLAVKQRHIGSYEITVPGSGQLTIAW